MSETMEKAIMGKVALETATPESIKTALRKMRDINLQVLGLEQQADIIRRMISGSWAECDTEKEKEMEPCRDGLVDEFNHSADCIGSKIQDIHKTQNLIIEAIGGVE